MLIRRAFVTNYDDICDYVSNDKTKLLNDDSLLHIYLPTYYRDPRGRTNSVHNTIRIAWLYFDGIVLTIGCDHIFPPGCYLSILSIPLRIAWLYFDGISCANRWGGAYIGVGRVWLGGLIKWVIQMSFPTMVYSFLASPNRSSEQ